MVEQTIYGVLDSLAERYIPEGKHRILHVDSRQAWVILMTELLETGAIRSKLSFLAKCAINWESLLVHKLSSQN